MIKIQVPATSANIGGGFDCMGIAVDMQNTIYIDKSDKLKIETDNDLPNNTYNLVYKSILKVFNYAIEKLHAKHTPPMLKEYVHNRQKPLPIYIKQINQIPKISGLGSSAACIVGGTLAANYLLGNIFTRQELVDIVTSIEGHPDNVLPCLLGGLVGAVVDTKGHVTYMKNIVSKKIRLCLLTPSFQLETKKSRQVLPAKYAVSDFVYSMSRAVLTFSALAKGDIKILKNVVGDKIHEPYRSVLIDDFDIVTKICKDSGAIATYLSGAGPSIAAIVNDKFMPDKVRDALDALPNNWRMRVCDVQNSGAKIEEVDTI